MWFLNLGSTTTCTWPCQTGLRWAQEELQPRLLTPPPLQLQQVQLLHQAVIQALFRVNYLTTRRRLSDCWHKQAWPNSTSGGKICGRECAEAVNVDFSVSEDPNSGRRQILFHLQRPKIDKNWRILCDFSTLAQRLHVHDLARRDSGELRRSFSHDY